MADFSRLLATAPGSCSEIQKELEAICGTSFSGSTYGALWKSLVAQLGERGATELVENTVKIRTARKVLMRGSQRSVVNALLTQMIEKARRAALGHLRKNVVIPPRVARRPNHVASFEHSLPILLPTGVRLKGRSNWLEANLEDYLWKHWDTLTTS